MPNGDGGRHSATRFIGHRHVSLSLWRITVPAVTVKDLIPSHEHREEKTSVAGDRLASDERDGNATRWFRTRSPPGPMQQQPAQITEPVVENYYSRLQYAGTYVPLDLFTRKQGAGARGGCRCSGYRARTCARTGIYTRWSKERNLLRSAHQLLPMFLLLFTTLAGTLITVESRGSRAQPFFASVIVTGKWEVPVLARPRSDDNGSGLDWIDQKSDSWKIVIGLNLTHKPTPTDAIRHLNPNVRRVFVNGLTQHNILQEKFIIKPIYISYKVHNVQISQNMSKVDECTTYKCKHKSKMQIITSYVG
jgi:hypothetical protein